MKLERTTRKTFLPWRLSPPFTVCLDAITIDGAEVSPLHARDPATDCRYDLSARAAHADALTLRVSLSHAALLAGLPPEEHDDPPIVVSLVLECGDGQRHWFRKADKMLRAGDTWVATTRAHFADLGSIATLRAIVARVQDAREDTAGLAARAFARVGESRPVVLQLEPPREVQTTGMLTVKWESFRQSNHPTLRDNPGLTWHIELQTDPPLLRLNSDVVDLHPVLHSKGTWGAKARMRDLINRTIALPVWLQLFCAAMAQVDVNEDGSPSVPEGWQRGVLQTLAPHMSDASAELALDHLLADIAETREYPERLVGLMERAGLAVHHVSDIRRAIDGALRDIVAGGRDQ